MNVINIHLDFPRKRESCVDCGGQVWNVPKKLSFFGKETCVDCGAMAGTCQHWLHLYTYLEPLTLVPLSHEIQSTSLRFQLEQNTSLEIHSDLLPPWPETPLSPSVTLRSKFGYRCQFAPVWSSTRPSHPLTYSRLEGKTTPSQIVTQIHQLQTTPSVSNIQLQEICQQQQYPHLQLQQEQRHEQQQQQQQKHKQQKQQSLQRKLQQSPQNKPTTASPKASPVTKTPDATETEAKTASATTSTVPASTRSIHSQTQFATTSTTTNGKASESPTAAIATVSTGKAAATTGLTADAVPKVVASSIQQQTYCATSATTTKGKTSGAQTSAFSLSPRSSTFATTTLSISKSPSEVKTTAPESKSSVPARQPTVETPKPQPAAAAIPAGAETALTASSKGTSADQQQSQQKQESQPTQPKQPKQRLSPVTQALDNYLQGISIPSIDQSDLKEPPQGQVVLGQGAYGGVLMMLYNNQPVAVKCVPTGDIDTVDREVRILSLLSQHDCFPNLHGVIEVGHFRAVAMQFIGDEASATCLTLGEALNGSRSLTLDPAEWRSIAMNVVDGIQHMHTEGLLHNDIKMDNILMSYDTQKHLWRAYVIDVGVATTTIAPRNYVLTSEEKERYRKFHAHIAPEMVDNGEPQSTQSDIFQLGYVLHSIGKFGAVHFLEQLGDNCKSRDPAQRPEITHIRYCIQNNTFI